MEDEEDIHYTTELLNSKTKEELIEIIKDIQSKKVALEDTISDLFPG